MSVVERMKAAVTGHGKKIVLPEYQDDRVVEAAAQVLKEGFAIPVLVGNKEEILAAAEAKNVSLAGADIHEPATCGFLEEMIAEFVKLREKKGMTAEQARDIFLKDPLFFGAMLVRLGKADGMVAGSGCPTANVLRSAIQVVGTQEGIKTVSGSFMMIMPTKQYGDNGVLFFADCAVIPTPTSEQLADIAITTVDKARKIGNIKEPRVAFLSFSTKGSAVDPTIDKVVAAVEILKERNVDFEFDGELQLDASIEPSVAAKKAPGSHVAGKANILIFPDLQSANIGYKLCQRFAGATAIGPMIQGLAAPIHDLSRGCFVQDIVDLVAISAMESL